MTGFVQSDYRTAVNSINLGQPLVESEPSSKIAGELRQIAASFSSAAANAVAVTAAAAAEAEPRRGIMNSLFRRHTATAGTAPVGLHATLNK